MTSQSPRIYLYKITFEEVPYYYYGVKKEKYFNQEYWGSPITNKWCWELYTPKKQILQLFDFTDEGWIEAQKVETRLIRPFYNTDKFCLNESCGGVISLEVKRQTGRKLGQKYGKKGGAISGKNHKDNGTGFFKLTTEEKIERSKKGGEKTKRNNTGIFSVPPEIKSQNSRKNANRMVEIGIGIHGFSREKRQEVSKISGKIAYEMKVGIHALTSEQRIQTGKKVASQRWMCLETGFITNAGNLTKYQRKRGIDTSKRVRIS
jgi:hypothetical protein